MQYLYYFKFTHCSQLIFLYYPDIHDGSINVDRWVGADYMCHGDVYVVILGDLQVQTLARIESGCSLLYAFTHEDLQHLSETHRLAR